MRRIITAVLGITIFSCCLLQAGETQYLVVADPVQTVRTGAGTGTRVLLNDILVYRSESQDGYSVVFPGAAPDAASGWIPKASVRPVAEEPRYNIVVKEKTAVICDKPADGAQKVATVFMGTRFEKIVDKGDYCFVLLPDRKYGWIARRAVRGLDERLRRRQLRRNIVAAAQLAAGDPGPASAGLDGAGLAHLVFRVNGIDIPRDCRTQWQRTEQLRMRSIKPGDLVFVSGGTADTTRQTLLYLGGEDLLDAAGNGAAIRITDFRSRFGVPMETVVASGRAADGTPIFFGRVRQ